MSTAAEGYSAPTSEDRAGVHRGYPESPTPPLTGAQIAAVEEELGFKLPGALREVYLRSNGGQPALTLYEDDDGPTVVHNIFPLTASSGESETRRMMMIGCSPCMSTWRTSLRD